MRVGQTLYSFVGGGEPYYHVLRRLRRQNEGAEFVTWGWFESPVIFCGFKNFEQKKFCLRQFAGCKKQKLLRRSNVVTGSAVIYGTRYSCNRRPETGSIKSIFSLNIAQLKWKFRTFSYKLFSAKH